MKETQKQLMIAFCTPIIICAVLVVLFESDLLLSGGCTENKSLEFLVLSIMELITICLIPLSLRLFRFGKVRKALAEKKADALLSWGVLRLCLLSVPMILNTLFYYLFMNVAFGYMAIILFLCLFLVVPTMDRCQSEVEK
jgi:hypothetical protein